MSFTPFDEYSGSPVLDLAVDSSRGVRQGKINWSDITSLAEYLFVTNTGLSRELPGFPYLRARSMHVEPVLRKNTKISSPGTSSLDYDNTNSYDEARVRIEYETPPHYHQQTDDPVLLLSHRWSIGGEFLTLESLGLQWSDEGKVSEDVTAGILIPKIEHQITWPRVQSPPFAVIRDRLGSVNNANLNFKTGKIFPETLLFLGAELHRDVLATGALAWEVTYRFSERRVPLAEDDTLGGQDGAADITVGGWNHYFRSEDTEKDPELDGVDPGFYRLEIPGTDDEGNATITPIYRLKDHSALFVEA